MKLKLTNAQLAVMYGVLANVKLGNTNVYESEIADLMSDLDHDGIETYLNRFYESSGLNEPELEVNCSNNHGFSITVS